jgi:arylformamidase
MLTIDPQLEREYNNRAMVPGHPQIFERWRQRSAVLRARTDCLIDVSYGEHPRHHLDLFRTPDAVGTVVFIHGGYWRSLDKSDFSFVAAGLLEAGLSVATINYRLCPAASIAEIIGDCRLSLDWLAMHGADMGLNLDRVALAGHSAGGHLVASLFELNREQPPASALNIVGGAAVSGVYDLKPLLRCSMNADLHLDAEAAGRLSPALHLPRLIVPLLLSVGGNESAAFRRQTADLHAAWPAICPPPSVLDGCNHFTVVDEFFAADSAGVLAIRALFG